MVHVTKEIKLCLESMAITERCEKCDQHHVLLCTQKLTYNFWFVSTIAYYIGTFVTLYKVFDNWNSWSGHGRRGGSKMSYPTTERLNTVGSFRSILAGIECNVTAVSYSKFKMVV